MLGQSSSKRHRVHLASQARVLGLGSKVFVRFRDGLAHQCCQHTFRQTLLGLFDHRYAALTLVSGAAALNLPFVRSPSFSCWGITLLKRPSVGCLRAEFGIMVTWSKHSCQWLLGNACPSEWMPKGSCMGRKV